VRPESLICTSDDKHPWPFHIGVPPPPPLGVKHPPSKAVLQSLAPCQVSYFLNFWCKYSISYRRNPLHWINFHKNVFMNSSYCNYINSSFPEGACSYRFNHSWLPKKKKTLKVIKLMICMSFLLIQAVIECLWRSTVKRIEENSNCLFIRYCK